MKLPKKACKSLIRESANFRLTEILQEEELIGLKASNMCGCLDAE